MIKLEDFITKCRFVFVFCFFAGDARRSTEATERHEREHWILSEESSGTRGEI